MKYVRARPFASWGLALALLGLVSCGGSSDPEPNEQTLKDSFSAQVASVGLVREFRRTGDELTFSGDYGDTPGARWLIRIETVTVEPNGSDPSQPYKGIVTSAWFVNDQRIEPRGTYADLPSEFLDSGLGQECWAFWDPKTRTWGWT